MNKSTAWNVARRAYLAASNAGRVNLLKKSTGTVTQTLYQWTDRNGNIMQSAVMPTIVPAISHEWYSDYRARRLSRFVCLGCGLVRWATHPASIHKFLDTSLMTPCRDAIAQQVMEE